MQKFAVDVGDFFFFVLQIIFSEKLLLCLFL